MPSDVFKVLDHESPPAVLETQLVSEALQRFPDWTDALPRLDATSLQQYQLRQQAECQVADRVVCPSTFAAKLAIQAGTDPRKVCILPFPMASRFLTDGSGSQDSSDRPNRLRILFLGNDAVRKGLPDLVIALERLAASKNSIEVRGCGAWQISRSAWARCRQVMETLGSIPREEVVQQYRWADVFVIPTYSDAMGVVILEAMAAGVPVIATTTSGGPDLIRDGVDGFVVSPNDSDAIAACLEQLATDRYLLKFMSQRSRSRAAEIAQQYPKRLMEILRGQALTESTANSSSQYSPTLNRDSREEQDVRE